MGEVTELVQPHGLEVTFYLKDGSEVNVIDPRIDAILDEVDQCGAPCSDFLVKTEQMI